MIRFLAEKSMGRSALALLIVPALLNGCSRSGSPLSNPAPAMPAAPTINAAVTASNIYSIDLANQSVDVYAANLNGTVSPKSSYAGGALSVTGDSAGNLYTATYSSTQAGIDVYAAGSKTPSRSITVAAATVNAPQINTIAVDSMNYLYVAISNSILVYDPAASGSATPVRTLAGTQTLLSQPATQMAFDTGNNLFVATGNGSVGSQVVEFPAGASGNIAPTVITSSDYSPTGVTLDASGNIYITQGNPYNPSQGTYTAAINVFPKGSVAGAKASRTINTGVELSTGQIFVDSGGNIFISTVLNGQTDFLVYSATAAGHAAPASALIRTQGSTTDSQFFLR